MFERLLNSVSITKKLTVIVMVSCGIALLLAGIMFVVYDHIEYKATMKQSLALLARVMASNSTAAVSFDSRSDAEEILSALSNNPHVVSAAIYGSNGRLLASYLPKGASETLLPTAKSAAGSTFEEGLLTYVEPIALDGEHLGCIAIRTDLTELDDRLKRFVLVISVLIGLAMLVAYSIVRRLQGLVSKPIVELANTASAISEHGDYAMRAQPGGGDEIGTLIATFNDMLSQIEQRDREVKAGRDFLEERVHERTRLLEVEISERKKAEESIRQSLQEKELLLKEVHHRVKNNLQIVNSLLNLQASKISDPHFSAMFNDSKGRVKSMALIHEKLYRSENLSEINFGEYVDSLCKYLMSTISGSLGRITIVNHVEDIRLGIDAAVPCGLIINELVMNSLKYAFPEGRAGEIEISCRLGADGWVDLRVSDNGIGIPAGFDIADTSSLGMQLVKSLTEQLDGRLGFDNDGGLTVRVEFFSKASQTAHRGPVYAG